MAELTVRYSPDDEWLGELRCVMESDGFSGHGSAWFDRTHLKTVVIPGFRAFPLSESKPPRIEGGFGNKEQGGGPEQCHLRIIVQQYNNRGHLLVRVNLASEVWKSADIDKQQTVTVRFLTGYEALGQFANDLEQMLDGNREVAVLASATI